MPEGTCSVSSCDRPVVAKGYCDPHYRRSRRGDVRPEDPIADFSGAAPRLCQVDGCDRRHYASGKCQAHWRRANRGMASTKGVQRRRSSAHRGLHSARAVMTTRDARRRGAPALYFSADRFLERMAYWGNRCWMCGGPFEAVDHVKPLAKGGWHVLANLRPSCHKCNVRKSAHWPLTGAMLAAIRERRPWNLVEERVSS